MSKSSRYAPKRIEFKEVRRRYWRMIARVNEVTGIYSRENLNRMKRGMPPRRLALIRNIETGETIEYHAPIELHHIFPLNDAKPVEQQAFIEVYPWSHAAIDDSRKFKFEFVEWRSQL